MSITLDDANKIRIILVYISHNNNTTRLKFSISLEYIIFYSHFTRIDLISSYIPLSYLMSLLSTLLSGPRPACKLHPLLMIDIPPHYISSLQCLLYIYTIIISIHVHILYRHHKTLPKQCNTYTYSIKSIFKKNGKIQGGGLQCSFFFFGALFGRRRLLLCSPIPPPLLVSAALLFCGSLPHTNGVPLPGSTRITETGYEYTCKQRRLRHQKTQQHTRKLVTSKSTIASYPLSSSSSDSSGRTNRIYK